MNSHDRSLIKNENFIEKTNMDAYVEIDLNAIGNNLIEIKKTSKHDIDIMAVVKSNAYGHDIIEVSKYLSDKKMVSAFAVKEIGEAILLRNNGITEDILLLNHTFPEDFKNLSKYNLIQAVDSKSYAEQLNRSSNHIRVHLEIDTGMGRTGILTNDEIQCIEEIHRIVDLSNLNVEGIFTHLSVADGVSPEDDEYTKKQILVIKRIYATLLESGVRIKHCHFLNSAGFLYYNDAVSTYARLGIILYGLIPNRDKPVPMSLQPALSVRAKISYIKNVDRGTYIGYGRTYRTERKTRVATVPVGYASGYPRCLSNNSKVIVNNAFAPIIGTICMGNMMIDVTDIGDVNVGDVVTLVGSSGDKKITLDYLAEKVGTINYELACRFSFALPKLIIGN